MSGAQGGVGRGEAQVYNMDRSLQAFDHLLQSQALERQREQKAIAEQLKTIDTKNLRDPDRDEYFQKYKEWQEATAKQRTARKRDEKYKYQSEAEMKYQNLKDFAARSAEAKKRDTDFGDRLLDDRFRDQFKDEAVTQFQSNFKKPISDPTYISDFNSLARQVDEEKINKRLQEVNASLLKRATWSNPIEVKHKQGNRSGVLAFNKREVSPEEQVTAYQNLYKLDRDFRKFVTDKYPGIDPSEALTDLAMQVRETGVMSEGTAPQFREDDNWREKLAVQDQYARAREDRAAARKGATAQEEETTQRQRLVDGVLRGDGDIENQLQGIVEASGKFMPKTDKGGKPAPAQLKIIKRKGSPVVTYVIPPKWVLNANGAQVKTLAREVTIDTSQPNAPDKINQMINDITDANITNESYRGQKGNRNKETAPIVAKPGTPAPTPKKTPPPVTRPKDNEGKVDSITVTLPNGKTGQIPAKSWEAFKKKYPQAKRQ